jgi:hypothetical protein
MRVVVDVSERRRTTQPFTTSGSRGGRIHAILPVQFFLESATVRTGEQRLMAVLRTRSRCTSSRSRLTGNGLSSGGSQARADHWLRSNITPQYSLSAGCEALNLDPQYLRRGLRAREQAGTSGRYPGMWMHIRAGTRDEVARLRVEGPTGASSGVGAALDSWLGRAARS